jgi:predicted nucleic acid-binding protein
MKIVADTNVFLSVVLNAPERPWMIQLTAGHELAAPDVLPFEIGNALSAMRRKGVLTSDEALTAWDAASKIAVTLVPVDVRSALDLAARWRIYAYDAYFLECAIRLRAPMLTLDKGMKRIAQELSIAVRESPR